MSELPLFPLKTVLFPGGPLPLRIFEPRYLDMISRSLKNNASFGVIGIRSGSETGSAEMFTVGTTADIANWYQDDDGLLAIMTIGRTRFRVDTVDRRADGLYVAEAEMLPGERALALPEAHLRLATFLEQTMQEVASHYRDIDLHFDDATWVGYRLAEILPLELSVKQAMLELDDPLERLERLAPILEGLENTPED